MASKEIQDKVKQKLFEEWMPDRPSGLKGLVNMAADAAMAVVGERVEFLEGELEAANTSVTDMIEALEQKLAIDESPEPDDDSDDAEPSGIPEGECDCGDASGRLGMGQLHIEDCPKFVDQTQYRCPQCAVTHKRDSAVGTRHAHLFYGGTPAVAHLEHCPVLKDEEATCNCNAAPPGPLERASAKRPAEGLR